MQAALAKIVLLFKRVKLNFLKNIFFLTFLFQYCFFLKKFCAGNDFSLKLIFIELHFLKEFIEVFFWFEKLANKSINKCENLFFVDVQETVLLGFSTSFDDGDFGEVLHSIENGDVPVGFLFSMGAG